MIAAQNAVIAAESLGIGLDYIGDIVENYEYHQKLFELPEYVLPISLLCWGIIENRTIIEFFESDLIRNLLYLKKNIIAFR